MILNEYGNTLRVDLKEDISANTNILYLTSPEPKVCTQEITAANGLVVGDQDIDVGDGVTFLANQYVEYVLQDGDINISGIWNVRVSSEDNSTPCRKITSDGLNFTVDP